MDIEQLREFCLGLAGATEQIQWENHLLFKVGGKMFAITSLEPSRVWLTFKANSESFAELVERPGIIPAPYLARAKWVGLESRDALSQAELQELLKISYELVVAKLTKKTRESLGKAAKAPVKARTKSGRKPAKARAGKRRGN